MASLVFYYASMNSGKSLSLITKHYMLKERGFNVVAAKPAIDTRSTNISTRLGLSVDCSIIEQNELISNIVLKSKQNKPDYILCDEAQFFSKEQIWDLAFLVDNWNINVICYGLRIDWKGEFFEGSGQLMKIADELIPIENICNIEKGANAFFHIKHVNTEENESIEVGYEDSYSSVSRKTWKKWYDGLNGNKSNTSKKQ